MKHTKRLISLLLTLCLTAGLFAGLTLDAFATDWNSEDVQRQLVVNTALAYFYKGGAIQYDSYYIGRGTRAKSAIIRQTNNRTPEDATYEEPIYTVCSAYPHDVYYYAFGQHVITDSMAPDSSKLFYANIDVAAHGGEYSHELDYPTSVLNTTSAYTYYGGVAARELAKQGIDITSRESMYREYPAHRDDYGEILFYFGPELNAAGQVVVPLTLRSGRTPKLYKAIRGTGEEHGNDYYFVETGDLGENSYTAQFKGSSTNLKGYDNSAFSGNQKKYYIVDNNGSTATSWVGCLYVCEDDFAPATKNTLDDLTFEDIQYLFDHVLLPGDIVTSMMGDGDGDADGGHAMMYIGDIDGDGVGELIHSWGAKYNNGIGPHSTDEKWKATGRTLEAYQNTTLMEQRYGMNYYQANITGSTNVSGYDIREAPVGWYYKNNSGTKYTTYGDGKNFKGGSGSMMSGPEGGGSIVIEDWNSRMGKYTGFTSTTKVNADGTYNYDTTTDNGTYYMAGADTDNTRSPYELTILRPLNSDRFTKSGWSAGANHSKGRYNLGDLSVTKLCEPGYRQAVTAGDTITYKVRLLNPQAVTGSNAVNLGADIGANVTGTYTVDVKEPIPAHTTFVGASIDTTYSARAQALNAPTFSDGMVIAEGEKIYNNNEIVTLTYTVSINDDVPMGTEIVSPEGKVWVAGSTASYLDTKEYTHVVGGTKLTDADCTTLLAQKDANLGSGSEMDIVTDIYAKLGADVHLPTVDAIFKTITAEDIQVKESPNDKVDNYYYKFKLKDRDKLTKDGKTMVDMIVPNYLGGERLMTYDENGIKTNMNRLRDFSENFIQPGDVLIYADTDGKATEVTDAKVYVYLGKDDTEHSYYVSYEGGAYTLTDAPLKDVQVNTTSSYRFLYSPILTQAFRYDLFLLLRPTQVVGDLKTEGLTLSSSAFTMEYGGETKYYRTLSAAINAANKIEDATAENRPVVTMYADDTFNDCINVTKPVDVNMNGHNLALVGDKGYINISGSDVTFRSGKITSDILAFYCGSTAQNIVMEDMEILGGDVMDCTIVTLSNQFQGSAIGRSGANTLTLRNVFLASRNSEVAPLQTGVNNSHVKNNITFADNVTIMVPPVGVTTAKKGNYTKPDGTTGSLNLAPWNTAKAAIKLGDGVKECVSPIVMRTYNGGPVREYVCYTYTSQPAAKIGDKEYATVEEAITAVEEDQTIKLQEDASLTDNATLMEGATLDAGENTITVTPGMTLTVAGTLKGAVTGDVAVQGKGQWAFRDDSGKDVVFTVPDGITEPVRYDEALVLESSSLNLDAAIRLNFCATKGGKMYVGGEGYRDGEEAGFYPTKPFNAREMSKTVPVTVTAQNDGNTYAGLTVGQSIRDYALRALKQVEDREQPENLGALMVSMLNYGAAAQKYFEDTSEIPANEGTDDYQEYVTTRDVATHEAPELKKDGEASLYYGTACVLGENMNMKFYLDLRNVEQERENYTYEISFVPCGKTKETVIPLSFNYLQPNETDGFYSYTLTQLVAKDIDTPVTFKILDGGTEKLSVTDSISGYLARVAKNRPECENVANAMLTFGIAAREYFIGSDPVLGDDELPLG